MSGSGETEVLLWASMGKTSRDIGRILSMSPRTADKHLEHVYVKLGVETRTARGGYRLAKLASYSSVLPERYLSGE